MRHNLAYYKKRSGLAVYIRKEIHFYILILSHLNKSNEDIELQCLIMYPLSHKRLVLFNVYRPPSGNLQNFLDVLSETMYQIPLHYSLNTFVMGYFNIDLSAPQSLNYTALIENLQNGGLAETTTNPMRHVRNNSPSLIDYLYTNCQCVADLGNLTLNISDHD